jgi:hypothetical protein
MPINRVGAAGIGSCTVAAQDIEDATLTNANFGPGSISNAQLANSSITVNGTSASLGGTLTLKEEINWQAVQVADGSTQVVATAGNGYFLDTNAGVIEVFLPSSPTRGDVVAVVDYAGTFATNQCIVNTGGVNIDSTVGSEFKLTTNETIAYFVYVDSNKGWMVYLNQAAGTTPSGITTSGGFYDGGLISATGGTITTSSDYKIHTFTGDGCFTVLSGGGPLATVDYLVVAGGGAGGANIGGGGGAGGYRESYNPCTSGCYSASPLATPTSLSVSIQTYPITVGAGGTATPGPGPQPAGGSGSNSIFSTITSAGGGGGGNPQNASATAGGSGGGARTCDPASANPVAGGAGNTPPVSPPQGNTGGTGTTAARAGGGGGATAVGVNGGGSCSGPGGAGATTSISGTPTAYAGGGGGGGFTCYSTAGTGGTGGGGNGGQGPASPIGSNGTANTGGGSGGGGAASGPAGTGGKGIVIIRYKFQ